MRLFHEDPAFDKTEYDSHIRRIHYDDRDAIMYENMLKFLWSYVVRPGCVEDYQGLLEEYTHWNLQMIDKVYYHVPHDVPYANIQRAYQSVVYLLMGEYEEGLSMFRLIGEESFAHDGKAPKMMMDQRGNRFVPVSKLFLLYNYAKVLDCKNPALAEELRQAYPFAFTVYDAGVNDAHNLFLQEQMETYRDLIFYPTFERVYKIPWGPRDFYMYYDMDHTISI